MASSDILVIVPRQETEHFYHEHDHPAEFWTLARAPKRCKEGDRIWFQINDKIVAWALIKLIVSNESEKLVDRKTENSHSMVCSTTGREWRGAHVCWASSDFHLLEQPIPGHAFFRGFKYVTIESQV